MVRTPPDTARLRFREFRDADAGELAEIFGDPYARRFFPRMQQEGAVQEFIARQLERYREHGHGLWVLERLADGAFVGDCGLTYQPAGAGEVLEVGYHVVAAYRRCGFATEAATACRDHAFLRLAAQFVTSIVAPENEASRAVAERVHRGMRWLERDGVLLCLYLTERSVWEGERAQTTLPGPAAS